MQGVNFSQALAQQKVTTFSPKIKLNHAQKKLHQPAQGVNFSRAFREAKGDNFLLHAKLNV
jgi:hypothetical protein